MSYTETATADPIRLVNEMGRAMFTLPETIAPDVERQQLIYVGLFGIVVLTAFYVGIMQTQKGTPITQHDTEAYVQDGEKFDRKRTEANPHNGKPSMVEPMIGYVKKEVSRLDAMIRSFNYSGYKYE